MSSLSTELRNIFGDDFDEHSLGEDDSPSNVFGTGPNEDNPWNNVETQAQEHTKLKGFSVVKRTSKRAVEGDEYKYARMVCDNLEVLGRIRLRKGLDALLC
ncbi:hypothetical protein ACS0TY_024731 [Phlomoides rotata]